MNCLDFQRELNADPRRLTEAARIHAETCPACAQRMVRQMNLETHLNAALQVSPPPGMEDRILFATRVGQRQRKQFLALAASVVAGVAVVLGLSLSQPDAAPDLVALAVGHVRDEPQHLHETVAVAPEKLNSLLALVGASGSLPATYANNCVLPNGQGGHIVLQTPHGRVTLMLIPNGKTDAMQRQIRDGWVTEVYAARRGSYSLVASSESALTDAKAILARQLRWT
ncbi:MAG: DUF3379 family protein [Thiobacillus sp.]|nr:DUF3379 family protein [Thiobacillus sp.]